MIPKLFSEADIIIIIVVSFFQIMSKKFEYSLLICLVDTGTNRFHRLAHLHSGRLTNIRRQLAVARLVAIPDLVRFYVVRCYS